MKKIKLITILLLLNLSAFSQIPQFLGIFDQDSCRFENQCGLLRLDTSAQNIWQIGKPAKQFFNTAYSQPNALITDTINPYPISNHSYFDLVLVTANYYFFDIIVGFKHEFQTDTLTDGGYIEVSFDNGQNWVNIIHSDTMCSQYHTENMYTTQDTLKGGINGFSGTSSAWIYTRVMWLWGFPLKSYPPDTILMRFHFISDSLQTNKDGWMIDNILISYANLGSNIQELDNSIISINILPNPFDNYTTIEFDNIKSEKLSLLILNPLGQIVKEFENITGNQIQIEKGDLTSGIYFVQLRNKQKIFATTKLMIK